MKTEWNLSDVFETREDALNYAHSFVDNCAAFEQKYAGKIADMSPEMFANCLKSYSDLVGTDIKIESYAYLIYSTHLNDSEVLSWYQKMNDLVLEGNAKIVFFTVEIFEVEKWDWAALSAYLQAGDIAWLKDALRFKAHTLSVDQEKLFTEMASMQTYLERLYTDIRNSEVYVVNGQQMSEGEVLAMQSSPLKEERDAAGKALIKVYKNHNQKFATIFNARMGQCQISSNWHHYDYPSHKADLQNCIMAEDLDNLVTTVVNSAAEVSQRYYKLKARLWKVPQISYWDRGAQYPCFNNKQEQYGIEEARDLILDAFERFSPEFARVGRMFFEKDLIDYYPRAGKGSGAYCMPMPAGNNPYLFLNFNGTFGSVNTMAHELGHGIHEYLSKQQGELGQQKSIAQSETASIFGETLVFQSMLEKITDKEQKLILLTQRIEEMISTSFRQISFHQFEDFAYRQRQKGDVSAQELNDAFYRFFSHYLGEGVDTTGTEVLWAYVSHFMQQPPFYVYSYCFSLCVVNALYEIYLSKNVADFEEKYIQMLKNGGIENYREALSHFGIDASEPSFWQKGIKLIKDYVDEFERLAQELSML